MIPPLHSPSERAPTLLSSSFLGAMAAAAATVEEEFSSETASDAFPSSLEAAEGGISCFILDDALPEASEEVVVVVFGVDMIVVSRSEGFVLFLSVPYNIINTKREKDTSTVYYNKNYEYCKGRKRRSYKVESLKYNKYIML